ncbi:MAG TPA: type II TA system antitoxin MqsA family protein [Longimicrobiaceae bacterium]|nr:type II TA system antitoxin MqsA family protein [Longimicrobiaceae bacterium]
MQCKRCERELETVTGPRIIRLRGGRQAEVEATVRRCPECGEVFWRPADAEAAHKAASDQIRREEGLLLTEEIQEIRKGFGLTQKDFEQLLGVGPKTVARWEAGVVFQSKAADALMRLLRVAPENAEALAEWHGVQLPARSGHRVA